MEKQYVNEAQFKAIKRVLAKRMMKAHKEANIGTAIVCGWNYIDSLHEKYLFNLKQRNLMIFYVENFEKLDFSHLLNN